jgi:ribosomal protein S18 acetylase RimI-like enzyme
MQIVFLNKALLIENIAQFLNILEEFPNEYWKEEHFLTDIKGKWEYSVYLKMPDKTVGGYIIASERNNSVHIHKFMIRKDLRNRGYGKSSFSVFQDYCKSQGKEAITLKVQKLNFDAIRFYRSLGFRNFNKKNELLILFKSII